MDDIIGNARDDMVCVSVSDGDAHAWGVVHSESRLLPTEVLGSKVLLVLGRSAPPSQVAGARQLARAESGPQRDGNTEGRPAERGVVAALRPRRGGEGPGTRRRGSVTRLERGRNAGSTVCDTGKRSLALRIPGRTPRRALLQHEACGRCHHARWHSWCHLPPAALNGETIRLARSHDV